MKTQTREPVITSGDVPGAFTLADNGQLIPIWTIKVAQPIPTAELAYSVKAWAIAAIEGEPSPIIPTGDFSIGEDGMSAATGDGSIALVFHQEMSVETILARLEEFIGQARSAYNIRPGAETFGYVPE
jgi:hypothetical protein